MRKNDIIVEKVIDIYIQDYIIKFSWSQKYKEIKSDKKYINNHGILFIINDNK